MTSSHADEAAQIAAAQREWSAAIVTNDAGTLADLMHDDWAIVAPAGVIDAAPFLEAIRGGALSHSQMQPASPPDGSPRIKIYGNTAVLTQRLLSTETANGHTRDNDEWMTTVFVRECDRWSVALMHLTPA